MLETTIDKQFMNTDERWAEIPGFPGYEVSDYGRVYNKAKDRDITPTKNSHGLMMVGLMRDGVQFKRSLALLIANAFVPRTNREEHESFDTPIHLDGDRTNNYYKNLKWRPLWFARKYMRQFEVPHTTYPYPIEDVETGEVYVSSMYAAMVHGLLDNEIVLAMAQNTYVWPTGQIFRKVVSRN